MTTELIRSLGCIHVNKIRERKVIPPHVHRRSVGRWGPNQTLVRHHVLIPIVFHSIRNRWLRLVYRDSSKRNQVVNRIKCRVGVVCEPGLEIEIPLRISASCCYSTDEKLVKQRRVNRYPRPEIFRGAFESRYAAANRHI